MNVNFFIPTDLLKPNNWILWRKEFGLNGKPTKIPYSAVYEGKASVKDNSSWSSHSQASAVRENAHVKQAPLQYDGLGFVFTKEVGVVFIDIDDCIDDKRQLSETASDILAIAGDTYVELSQSNKGLHIFLRGSIPRNFKNSNLGVEMYDHDRYCAITGLAMKSFEIRSDQPAINRIFDTYKTIEKKTTYVKPIPDVRRSSMDIIQKASGYTDFRDLYYDGNWQKYYPSQSEADLKLCNILAFWTDRDEELIDSIFCSSQLYREKWNRPDYKMNTIRRACASCMESVTEYVRRKNGEQYDAYRKAFLS